MRKIYPLLLFAVLLLLALPAQADGYNFGGIYMTLDVPNGDYLLQLTPDNLTMNEAAVTAMGEMPESLKKRFEEEGILLWAEDEAQGRTLIVTAVQDDQSKALYDINEQTPATRATYRTNHSNGTYCGAKGYKFESCEWKNFGSDQGRFLMLKYTQKIDGKVKYRGLWRRTVRNGYTITLDLRVEGRQVTAGDINALNKLQDSISFMQVTSAPDAPLSLGFTAPPPETTNDAAFTIKGGTRPGAKVIAAYASLRSSRSKVFTATADGKGAFAIDITLPSSDYYNMIVTAVVNEGMENEESVSQEFSVDYDPTMIAVTFTSPFPQTFTGDSFKLTGTTLTGVTIQLIVNDQLTTKKTGNNRTFAFNVDTSKEGMYDIQMTFSKKGFATEIYNYTIERKMGDEERKEAIRSASQNVEYGKLSGSASKYAGKVLRFNGYIVDVSEGVDEWVITFATSKTGDKFGKYIIVLSDTPVAAEPEKRVMLYGTVSGDKYLTQDENGEEQTYPKMNLAFFDDANV